MKLVADYERFDGRTAPPVLDVGVSAHSEKTVKCRGIIDTGASISMIAPSVVDALNLKSVKSVPLAGIAGPIHAPAYVIRLSINGTVFENILAAGFEEEARMLIGRNVINLWDLRLSGRERKFVLEPWSTEAQDAWDNAG